MYDQRTYSRGSHFNGHATVSVDGENWHSADVSDISSGGLKFRSPNDYSEGDTLWFDLFVESFLTEFEVKTRGVVRRKIPVGGGFVYGIAFRGLSHEKKIQIDENVHNDRPVDGGGYETDM